MGPRHGCQEASGLDVPDPARPPKPSVASRRSVTSALAGVVVAGPHAQSSAVWGLPTLRSSDTEVTTVLTSA